MSNWPRPPVTAAQAIARIHPGQRILIDSGAAEPTQLVEALVTHGSARPSRSLHQSPLAAGLAGLDGDVRTGNRRMMSLLQRPAMVMDPTADSGVSSVVAGFRARSAASTSPGPSSGRLEPAARAIVSPAPSGTAIMVVV
ncbi:MAG: hypothetical protein WKG00_10470 [Polyangiaceae bacterium]